MSKFLIFLTLSSLLFILGGCVTTRPIPTSVHADQVRRVTLPKLEEELEAKNLELGDPVFIRIFKEEQLLEVWLEQEETGKYELFKTYQICDYSGVLGPKQQEGDKQAPEGFYDVTAERLNPNSDHGLSFNIGYPNAYDSAHGYTGGMIMVHGDCTSIGCFAMTTPFIEEIYMLVEQSLSQNPEPVPVHVFPFRMTDDNVWRYRDAEWLEFWRNLRRGYEIFEILRVPPEIVAEADKYHFYVMYESNRIYVPPRAAIDYEWWKS